MFERKPPITVTVTVKGGPNAGKSALIQRLRQVILEDPQITERVAQVRFEELTTRKGITRV